ncbi:hypothetical protein KAI04_00800 [Candidatus Pacearchaeota archaeon]|nr:hypothetical protein [Candidatus Pacearchaeota archaeon]
MEHENHEPHSPHVTHHKKEGMTEKIRTNPWIMSTFVLGILAIILIVGSVSGGITGKTISEDKAGEYLVSYFEAQGVEGFSVDSVENEEGFYKVNIDYQEQLIPFYVTKSGYLTGNSILLITPQKTSSVDTPVTGIVKSDVPEVELFVMTHCPYGTQAEKGFIPAILEFGNEIDASIKFVHYYLHEGEKQEPYETPIQVCLREEQSDLFLPYLNCFLEDGDSDRCVIETGIDKSKLDSCVQNNAESYYALDSALSEGYGVRGSPTLVVNGNIVTSGRSAAEYADVICQAFNVPPELCGELDLDSASPSPGFGWDTTSSSTTTAQC